MIPAAAAAARVAGVVVAAGYLLGLVDGGVTGAIGGLALVTFGRALTLDHVHEVRFAAALAVVAGGVGVAVLRWGTLDLEGLRGAQAVLGPTVLVGPERAAAACIAAAAGALFALAVWLESGTAERGIPIPETVIGSALLTAGFWGPAPRGWHVVDLGVALVAIVIVGGAATGLALVLRRSGGRALWAALGLGAVAVSVAAGLLA